MEEILASIRRIIEDSDTSRPPVEDNMVQPKPPVEPEPADSAQFEVEAFRAGLDEPAPAAPVKAAEAPEAFLQPVEPERPTAAPFSAAAAAVSSNPIDKIRACGHAARR